MCHDVLMSTRIHIVVDDELLAAIDEKRGDVPRSAWCRTALKFASSHYISRAEFESSFAGPHPEDVQRAVRGARVAAARSGGLVGQLLEDAADRVEPRPFRPYPKGGR